MSDITQSTTDPFPPSGYREYLKSGDVQAPIGVIINYTETNTVVATVFQSTGDYDRGGQISEIAYFLSMGIRVALIYGDADYNCR